MPLPIPTISDRTYQQILDEALARAPVHNPEWTSFNDSDPGVTMLQLFAFMTESLLYRANLIPERNRRKFLRLLGVHLQPAEPALGLVTFSNLKGPIDVKLLRPDVELSAGQVPFRTLDGIDVLPVEGRVYYKAKPTLTEEERLEVEALYQELYASLLQPGQVASFYETKQLEPPANGASMHVLDLGLSEEGQTVDGILWLALLARRPDEVDRTRQVIANKVLSVAIVPAVTDAERTLLPGGQIEEDASSGLRYEIPNVVEPDGSSGPRYRQVEARPSGNLLAEPGVVELQLPGAAALRTWREEDLEPLEAGARDFPPSLEDAADAERVITWIRIRLAETPEVATSHLRARVSFVGVNGSRVTQRARVSGEFLGQGTGEPDQKLALANVPVIPESVQLTVNGDLWRRIDDLAAAPPEVPRRQRRRSPGTVDLLTRREDARVFTVDRESGLIEFGNGLHGARPPDQAIIQASYDYGGGLQGMVGIGSINKGAALPAGIKATNPIPTWGGDEPETVDEAERRIPLYLQHRNRLVSEADFKEITLRTPGVDIGRVEVRPLVHPDVHDFPARGVVTLVVLPRFDPEQPAAPRPDRLFLDTICRYLNPRRLLTTEIHVRGPSYVPVYVSVGIDVAAGRDLAPVRERVKNTIRRFLSPLAGGFEGQGWPLDHDVDALELLAVAARVDGVTRINGVLLGAESGPPAESIPIGELELPHVLGVSVAVGEPAGLDEIRGEIVDVSGPQGLVPIPIVPPEC